MLRELHISNLAVIEDVTIELGEGFNCFTGQTGAGKSLVLGAFEILLGLRGGVTEMLRPGAEEARVSGVFELHDAWIARQVSQALDVPLAPGEQLLITRKFFASGRSSVSVNGQPATASMVRAIGELLFEKFGKLDPLTVRFTDLHKHVLALDGFEGKPEASNEKLLEAIQMAWYEEWQDEYGG